MTSKAGRTSVADLVLRCRCGWTVPVASSRVVEGPGWHLFRHTMTAHGRRPDDAERIPTHKERR